MEELCQSSSVELVSDTKVINARDASREPDSKCLYDSGVRETSFIMSLFRMRDFTYGKKLRRNESLPVTTSIKTRLMQLAERRQQRITLRNLYEKKAASICGDRDSVFIDKVGELN